MPRPGWTLQQRPGWPNDDPKIDVLDTFRPPRTLSRIPGAVAVARVTSGVGLTLPTTGWTWWHLGWKLRFYLET